MKRAAAWVIFGSGLSIYATFEVVVGRDDWWWAGLVWCAASSLFFDLWQRRFR